MVEEEDKPAGESSKGINPLELVHDPYRAEFKERLRKLNTCDRDMRVPNKTFYLQQFDMYIVNDAA